MESHLPTLISDLAVILVVAGFISIVFKKLNQPVVLGYIIAGFLVGPHVQFFPTILDLPNLKVWSEIGVIFLLFALGLEFSFKKLARVGGTASVTAFIELFAMLIIGYLTGMAFGWSKMDSLFLGGILSISSTTIIIRAFEEAGVKTRKFANLVFGILIVEDLGAILLIVLLTTVSVSHQVKGLELAGSIGKLLFFLTLWFVSGLFLVPTFLRKLKLFLNDETLLVVSVGLCFLMVVLSAKAGFSPALGAFIMGSIFAETTDAEKIEHLIGPLKSLFAAIFFVSVGTLLDPAALITNLKPVLIITLITLVGKTLSSAFGALLSGQSVRHSVQVGFSLSQIGEFSFIIAGLGLSLNVTSDFLYPIAVGVSILTTFSTPYMIRFSDRAADYLDRSLPKNIHDSIDAYSRAIQTTSATTEWSIVLRANAKLIFLNAVLITAIFLGFARLLAPSGQELLAYILACLLSAPFWWAWIGRVPAREQLKELWKKRSTRLAVLAILIFRIVSAFLLFVFLTSEILGEVFESRLGSTRVVSLAFFSMLLLLMVFSNAWKKIYRKLENRMITNLGARENEDELPRALAPWDAHLTTLEVMPHSPLVGMTYAEAMVREKFGVMIATMQRGSKVTMAPASEERLYPFDRLSVIGADREIDIFREQITPRETEQDSNQSAPHHYTLHRIFISAESRLNGVTLRDSRLKENAKSLVVGLERGGERILNPDSNLEILGGDILWILGDTRKLSTGL